MSREEWVAIAIFYGGLSIVVVIAVLYALYVSRRSPAKARSIAVESADALNHELADRAHVAAAYVRSALGEHPALARRPELARLYREAADRLEDLSQAAGTKAIGSGNRSAIT